MTHFNIQGSVAFVTGTNKKNGIGYAIVEALLAHGSRKVYATARDASQLDELVTKWNGRVVAVSLELTEDLQAIAKLGSEYPDVTLVVNNAGIGFAGHLSTEASLDSIEFAKTEILVNYLAPLAIVKSFAPVLLTKTTTSPKNNKNDSEKASAVINVASIASFVNMSVIPTYSASKAAAHSLTQAQRRELPNSLVVGVYPGPVATDMIKDLPEFEGVPASDIAEQLIRALQTGTEDIFPDAMSSGLHEAWRADAKAMEVHIAQAQEVSQ
jgi:NAD(P)-dependent dehydrogenase (short-subunit alcohol dehydrogenase family)